MQVGGKSKYAHRLMWEEVNGPIPHGMCVLHRCDNPPCIRPDHLFLGTKADNVRDMIAKGRDALWSTPNKAKTVCKNGHPFDRVAHRGNGAPFRYCSICAGSYRREYRAKKRGGA